MSKAWFDHYPEGTPKEINPDTYASLTQLFRQSVERFADLDALECFGASLTYGELDRLSDAVASLLQERFGVEKGDRIAVMLPNIFAYPIVMWGILKAGAVQVNVNPQYTARELEHQLNDSEATVIFCFNGSTQSLAAVRNKTGVHQVVTVAPGDGSGLSLPEPPIAAELGDSHRLSALLQEYAGKSPMPAELDGGDTVFLQYTGGTTGPSKGATLSHRNLVANSEQFKAFVPEVNEPGKERVVLALPMYHIFGLMLYTAYAAIGAKAILIPNPRDIEGFLTTIKDAGFTVMAGVNTLYAGMAAHPLCNDVDFSLCKVSIGGGSKIFPSTSDRWQALSGTHILEGFGLSETSPILTLNPLGQDSFTGTVGFPVPSTEVKILGTDGTECLPGEPGELCAKGPQVMSGYWKRPDANAECFTEDGYFRTGDIAVMHPDGLFEIVDRKKDMLIVSGFNVYPNEIEAIVCELDAVAEAACVGAPDEKTGERVKLFVAGKGPDLDVDVIVKHCRDNLAAYKVPKEVVVLDELPKSSVGKILRKELR